MVWSTAVAGVLMTEYRVSGDLSFLLLRNQGTQYAACVKRHAMPFMFCIDHDSATQKRHKKICTGNFVCVSDAVR
jgi:hypothetical protein